MSTKTKMGAEDGCNRRLKEINNCRFQHNEMNSLDFHLLIYPFLGSPPKSWDSNFENKFGLQYHIKMCFVSHAGQCNSEDCL